MALITFPRAMPDELPIVGLSFTPSPMIELSALRSGRQIAKELGPTLWRATWRTAKMTDTEAGIVRSWYDTLLSLEAFLGYDKLREYPLAYKRGFAGLTVGSNPFAGTCTLAGVASDNLQVSLSALPIGLVLSRGDYLAFDYGTDSRALHRCSAAATANGSGTLTIEVRPHVRTGWTAGATVALRRAAAHMKVVPDTWSEQTDAPFGTTVSFEAIQTL
ncbi:hypothetical protein RA307_23100 [Xanthobacteraceae bacterium Astr-EGSB]|uniref:hypothetical protein n=1 Tax=Astrobacterium formosum TaxID=3069710 RepID=UPI0027B68C40|nr:hypothetical protein [Xanthobacteraceae bacterium Astr-EGSB]